MFDACVRAADRKVRRYAMSNQSNIRQHPLLNVAVLRCSSELTGAPEGGMGNNVREWETGGQASGRKRCRAQCRRTDTRRLILVAVVRRGAWEVSA